MDTQSEITAEWNRQCVGARARALIEAFDAESGQWTGRTASEAPEIDGNVFVQSDSPLQPGSFANVEIIDSEMYDLHTRAI